MNIRASNDRDHCYLSKSFVREFGLLNIYLHNPTTRIPIYNHSNSTSVEPLVCDTNSSVKQPTFVCVIICCSFANIIKKEKYWRAQTKKRNQKPIRLLRHRFQHAQQSASFTNNLPAISYRANYKRLCIGFRCNWHAQKKQLRHQRTQWTIDTVYIIVRVFVCWIAPCSLLCGCVFVHLCTVHCVRCRLSGCLSDLGSRSERP